MEEEKRRECRKCNPESTEMKTEVKILAVHILAVHMGPFHIPCCVQPTPYYIYYIY